LWPRRAAERADYLFPLCIDLTLRYNIIGHIKDHYIHLLFSVPKSLRDECVYEQCEAIMLMGWLMLHARFKWFHGEGKVINLRHTADVEWDVWAF
jgi:hypothetical protein